MNLDKARILVTGGSSGLGKAMAAALIAKGAHVAITGRDPDKLQRVAEELGATPLEGRMDRESELMLVFAQLDAMWGGLDVLINNAGIGRFEPMQEVEQSHFDEVFPTNVYGPALAGREAVKRFMAQGYGHIINVASSAGVKGFKNGTVYAASKFALRGMTECWREELRPHNIRVMLINPSAVPTAFNVTDRSEKELRDKMLTPNEIAHAAVAVLELDDRGFIPELGVWATNPF